MIQNYFSRAYISHPERISVKSTWAGIQSYFVILRFVLSAELFRAAHSLKQDITGDSWDEMFRSFRQMVSNLYEEWYEYLEQSIKPREMEFYEPICLNTASVFWRTSLERLSYFLARKSGRRVMVLIDEYEVPNNLAYKHGYFDKVRFSHYS